VTIISEQKRCLVISCSRSKKDAPEPLPAMQRYTGPMYKVLHRYLREKPEKADHLAVYILSARHGLIDSKTPILPYDQKMTPARAAELHTDILRKAQQKLALSDCAEIFLAMGQTYLLALDGLETLLSENTKLVIASGSAGKKLTELRNWLWGISPATSLVEEKAVVSSAEKVTVVLRGHTLALTTAEAIENLKTGLTLAPSASRQLRSWYIEIAGEKISPKWAAQYLFGVPVGDFSADEARRALRRMGLSCYRT